MDKIEAIEKLKNYKELLSKKMSFDALILYGSYANGKYNIDSDIDVAVVVDEMQGDYFETRPLLWQVSRDVDDRIEPHIFEKKHDESGFLEEIMNSGIVI